MSFWPDREQRAVEDADHREHQHQRREVSGTRPGTAAGSSAGSRTCRPCRARRPAARPPPIGASAPASGSQVWNGTSGALIANAMKKPRNSQLLQARDRWCRRRAAWKSNVPARCWLATTYSPITEASMISPPSSEYRKNFTAAYCRRGPPKRPDEEVHRDQHGLEEHVEQEDVGGREDADHHRLEQQQQREERLRLAPAGAQHPGRGGVRVGDQDRVRGGEDVRVVVVRRPVQDRGGRPGPAGGPATAAAAARAATPRRRRLGVDLAVAVAPGRDHHRRTSTAVSAISTSAMPSTPSESSPRTTGSTVRRDELEPRSGRRRTRRRGRS